MSMGPEGEKGTSMPGAPGRDAGLVGTSLLPKRMDPAGPGSIRVLQTGRFGNTPCTKSPALLVTVLVCNRVSGTLGSPHSRPVTRQDQTAGDNRDGPKGRFPRQE